MGTQSQSQSQSQGKSRKPGDDPGTLTDEDQPLPDSPPGSRRDQVQDPQRSTGAEDRSNSM